MNTKRWYTSKTLWFNIVALVSVIVELATGNLTAAEVTAVLLPIVNLILRKYTSTGVTR